MKINRNKINCTFPFLSILVFGVLMTGCSQHRVSPPQQEIITASPNLKEHRYKLQQEETIPVIRYGRYRLVEVGATPQQRTLLNQIIDLNIPLSANNKATVTQGLNYVLLNSGYRLCSSKTIEPLSSLELPLAHYHLGPIRLQEALEVLVGNAWQLTIDEQEQTVCFTPINTLIDVQAKKDVNNEI